jgi:hypothetical protein
LGDSACGALRMIELYLREPHVAARKD